MAYTLKCMCISSSVRITLIPLYGLLFQAVDNLPQKPFLFKVLLVVVFGKVERGSLDDLGYDRFFEFP
jgi:hypothetical protein